MDNIYLISDTTSANDLLNFKRYVSPLIQILENFETQTPFTIGIFGPWGTGKSTLIEYIDRRLAESVDVQFHRIRFNPWIYRSEKNLIVPLLHSIQDDLEKSPDKRIVEAAKKIGTVLA
ncbi:MAG TPA: P-loop NTPase fold protein, partial [Pyrinomonadaceae bacterium]|nr:P-loop NTPase fold protein [Pyrinomonadaceae bacterium]